VWRQRADARSAEAVGAAPGNTAPAAGTATAAHPAGAAAVNAAARAESPAAPATSTASATPAASPTMSAARPAPPPGARVAHAPHVPPPGARTSRPAPRSRLAFAALPPGGRPGAAPTASTPQTSSVAADALAAAEAGIRAARAAAAASAAGIADGNGFGVGIEAPPMSAWATPVGATTHAEFRPEGWGGAQDETQQERAQMSRPVMWGLVLLIAATLAFAGVWISRHFATERELAALARVAALPNAEESATPAPSVTPPAAMPLPADARADQQAPLQQAAAPDSRTVQAMVAGTPPATASAMTPTQTPTPAQTTTETSATSTQTPTPAASAGRLPPTARKSPPPRRAAAATPIANSERAMSKLSPRAREYLYSQAFKRCPAPGLPGALQCRKHICNGAEGRNPACYHINRLNIQ